MIHENFRDRSPQFAVYVFHGFEVLEGYGFNSIGYIFANPVLIYEYIGKVSKEQRTCLRFPKIMAVRTLAYCDLAMQNFPVPVFTPFISWFSSNSANLAQFISHIFLLLLEDRIFFYW
jgi:hypothetical protein